MASVVADLVVNLIGNDTSLVAAAKKSTAALEETAGAANSGKNAFQTLANMGKYAGVALAGIGAYAIDSSMKFSSAMELIHTQAHASQDQVDSLSKSVLALAPTVGQGPDELAAALYHIVSAAGPGLGAAGAMDILTAAAKNAATGMADMEDTANALVAVMVTAPTDVKDAADATAYLNTIVGIGNMKMQDLVSALGTGVLPAFKSAGLGLSDFGASLAVLTDMGEPANMAATRLRTSIALLTAPTKKAQDALATIGITQNDLANDMSKPGGLLIAMEDLQKHLSGLSQVKANQVLEEAFGGARTGSTIEALVQNIPRLQQKYDMLGTTASRAATQQDAWNATQKQFTQQAKELGASLQVMAIQLGNKLLPYVTKLVTFLTEHQGAMKAVFIMLIVFLGLLTVMWIANAIAEMAALWPIYLLIAAIILLVAAGYYLYKHWGTIWGNIKKYALDVWHALVDAWNATAHGFMVGVNWIKSNVIDPVVHFFQMMGRGIANVIDFLVREFMFFWHIIEQIMKGIEFPFRVFAAFMGVIFDDITAVWDKWTGYLQSKANWINDNVIHPLWIFWHDLFFVPMQQAFNWLTGQIDANWEAIKTIFSNAWKFISNLFQANWNVIKGIWDWAVNNIWNPMWNVAAQARNIWGQLWDFFAGKVSWAWNELSDFFGHIVNAIKDVLNWWHSIENAPGIVGSTIAHVLGFAEGGVVPGPVGAPMLAVVHGGEIVIPNSVSQNVRTSGGIRASGPSRVQVAAAAQQDHAPVTVPVYIDGKKLMEILVTRAQRHKNRNNSTFLT